MRPILPGIVPNGDCIPAIQALYSASISSGMASNRSATSP